MARSDASPRPAATTSATLVGRQRDLRELQDVLGDAMARRGSLVLISGEPGIGKTRLVQELADVADGQDVGVVWGTARAGEGAPPYWPWMQVIRSVARASPDALRELGRAAGDLAPIAPDIADRRDDVAARSLSPEHERFSLFDAVASLLDTASRSHPLVVVLDDLHEADEPSLRLLAFVASRLPTSRTLVLGTHRNVDRGHPLGRVLVDLGRDARRLHLEGLTRSEVRELLVTLLAAEPSPLLIERVHGLTAGNPFFVREVLRLRPPDAEGEALELAGVPEAVREVLDQRLAGLSAWCREIVGRAAVLGQEFGMDVLSRLTDRSREDVVAALDEAVAAGIVWEVPVPADRYAFIHSLLRETIYEGLGKAKARALHREIGEVLEAIAGDDPEAPVDELAHHFLKAGAGSTAKAVEYGERAGRRAMDRLAYEDAGAQFERALQGLGHMDPQEERRLELLLALADARKRAGAIDASREALGAAADLARKLGRPEALSRAALGFRSVADYYGAGTVDERVVRLLEEALAPLPPSDSAARARLLAQLSWEIYFADFDRSVALCREALQMARRVGEPLALGVALHIWHAEMKMLEPTEARLAAADELIGLAEETGIEELALWGRRARFVDFMERGEIYKADAERDAFARLAERLGDRSYRWWPAMWKTMLALLQGRFAEGEQLAEKALIAGRARPGAAHQHHDAQMTLIRDEQGRLDELEPIKRAGAEALPKFPIYRARLALLLGEIGREQEARAELGRLASDDFAGIPKDYVWDAVMAILSELCGLLGDTRRAAEIYQHLEPFSDRWVMLGHDGTAVCRGPVHRYLGILAATMEKWELAETHFESALQECSRAGALPWAAHIQYEYAGMLLRRRGEGDQEQAVAHLQEAAAITGELGMRRLEELVRNLMHSPEEREPLPADENRFRRDGEVWTLAYGGKLIRMKDSKGLRDIARLLASPEREIHVADLVTSSEGEPGPLREAIGEAGLRVTDGSDGGPLLDERARAEYRARIVELQEELDRAQGTGDPERASRAKEELDVIAGELASAYGLGGRARTAANPVERARKAVTTRIRNSVKRIEREHPALARHLDRSIRTGRFCRYAPDAPLRWNL